MLKQLMEQTLNAAISNLKLHGYLEKVLMAMTDRGPFVNNLQWNTKEEERKTIENCVNAMSQMGCQSFVMVGETFFTKIQLQDLIGVKFKEVTRITSADKFDSILITGATRKGEQLAVMTPYFKEKNEFVFVGAIWGDPQTQFRSSIHDFLVESIFRK